MAGIRDPSFWKRFSVAVHREEGHSSGTIEAQSAQSSTTSFKPASLKQSNSWLERQQQKKSRRTCICWIFWLCFFGLVAGVVLVVLWMTTSGPLSKSAKNKAQ